MRFSLQFESAKKIEFTFKERRQKWEWNLRWRWISKYFLHFECEFVFVSANDDNLARLELKAQRIEFDCDLTVRKKKKKNTIETEWTRQK